MDRYSRQMLFAPIGEGGQKRLGEARVGLVGLGALGSCLAETLVRCGIGHLVAVDRDIIEPSNLHRQGLYSEEDARERRPKAEAAGRALGRMNGDVRITCHVTELTAENALELFGDCDLLLDGTDSFETRYLLNDLAIHLDIPWIYGACVAATGMTATIIPQVTPCLTCLFPDPPAPGQGETCDTAGIIAPAAQIAAALQVTEALKLLTGNRDALRQGLLSFELWPFRLVELGTRNSVPRPDCRSCGQRDLQFLDGMRETHLTVLCGRDSVQIRPPKTVALDLEALGERLEPLGEVSCRGLTLEFTAEGLSMTLFRDGRALIRGTTRPEEAKQFYARFVGH